MTDSFLLYALVGWSISTSLSWCLSSRTVTAIRVVSKSIAVTCLTSLVSLAEAEMETRAVR